MRAFQTEGENMFGGILFRMIFIELLKVFSLSLVALTGLFLMAGLVAEATQRGLAPSQILAVMPLLIPNTLPYTIPATTLFATCVVYGRMAHDNEIVAIKAAGVNLRTILVPCVLLGLGTSAITMSLYYYLIPYTHQVLRKHLLSDSEEVLYGLLKRNHCIKFPRMPYAMYVREVQGKRLIDVIFKKRAKKTDPFAGYDLVAWAKEAKLHVVDRPHPVNDQIVVDMERCTVRGESTVNGYFKDRRFEVDLPTEFMGTNDMRNRPTDLTWVELFERWDEALTERVNLKIRLALITLRRNDHDLVKSRPNLKPKTDDRLLAELRAIHPENQHPWPDLEQELRIPATDLELHFQNLASRLFVEQRIDLGIMAELNMRPALSLGCLCFVLVGCPVGIWFSRSDYLSSFVTCFLPIVFVYYPLMLCGANLAKEGKAPAMIAVWMADALFLLTASFMLYRLVRR